MITGSMRKYRGYYLIPSPTGVRITTLHDADVICTEPSIAAAQRVINGWIANRHDS